MSFDPALVTFTTPLSFPNLRLSPDGDAPSGAGSGDAPPKKDPPADDNQIGGGSDGAGEADGEDEGVDPDTVIDVDGEPVKISTLVEERRRAKAAAAAAAANGDDADDDSDDDTERTPKRRKAKARRENRDRDHDDRPAGDDRLAALEKAVQGDRAKRYEAMLRESAIESLRGVEGVEEFFEGVKQPRRVKGKDGKPRMETDEEAKARTQRVYDGMLKEIIDRSVPSLVSRQNREGRFDESWFEEATAKVAQDRFEWVRSALGDADMIGRSTETESEVSEILSGAEVEVPEFKPGMNLGQLKAGIQASLADGAAKDAAQRLVGTAESRA